jgi:hypothetical protein
MAQGAVSRETMTAAIALFVSRGTNLSLAARQNTVINNPAPQKDFIICPLFSVL